MITKISPFDDFFHDFKCESPKCGETFSHVLRSLLDADEVVCPKCGTAIDIRESKRTGEIWHDFDNASELEKKINEEK